MQLVACRVVLVQQQSLPASAFLLVQFLRSPVRHLHQFGFIDVDARLPGERLRVDVLTVAIVIAEAGIVRTAEREASLQAALLVLIGRCADAPGQLRQRIRSSQFIIVRERTFLYECPVLLFFESRIDGYLFLVYTHKERSLLSRIKLIISRVCLTNESMMDVFPISSGSTSFTMIFFLVRFSSPFSVS